MELVMYPDEIKWGGNVAGMACEPCAPPAMLAIGERLTMVLSQLGDAGETLGHLEGRLFGPQPEPSLASGKAQGGAAPGVIPGLYDLLDELERRVRRIGDRAHSLSGRL